MGGPRQGVVGEEKRELQRWFEPPLTEGGRRRPPPGGGRPERARAQAQGTVRVLIASALAEYGGTLAGGRLRGSVCSAPCCIMLRIEWHSL
mmetsp:Transcript_70745/g.223486  ORF Transcript_70745/g.223486 Transcript_70745/m.223486 type:complete len:91 (+) Transcript_70745:137-409(+)